MWVLDQKMLLPKKCCAGILLVGLFLNCSLFDSKATEALPEENLFQSAHPPDSV